MKSNKNQASENEANVVYTATPYSGIQHEKPVKETFESVPDGKYGQLQNVIVRRFALDSNGGGYAGL